MLAGARQRVDAGFLQFPDVARCDPSTAFDDHLTADLDIERGGLAAERMAWWDGNFWQGAPSGPNNTIFTLRQYDDPTREPVLWVGGLVTLGYFFGNVPFIKKNLSLLVVFIILLSLVPMIIGVFRSRFGRNSTEAKPQ
jgi:hypothetical protein